MSKHLVFLLILIGSITGQVFSQGDGGKTPSGTIAGHVIDSVPKAPIEYTSIVLYTQFDSVQVAGTITDGNGDFHIRGIPPGLYFLEIRFIGYTTQTIDDVVIRHDQPEVDLGTIELEQTVLIMEGDEVVAEKPALEYRIDKKVINVGQQPVAPSGTAVDVLENVPSVTVDNEGNVFLRGSGSFLVLVDDRPSLLEPSEALQQIPAGSIETIEIITNPSARYDPDGTSGIINIVMKKSGVRGRSGIINGNAGLDDKYGGDILLNFRNGSINANIGADYSRRFYPGTSLQESETSQFDTTSFVRSDGSTRRGRKSFGLRGEVEIKAGPKDRIAMGLRYGNRAMEGESDLDYVEWSEPGQEELLYRSLNNRERSGDFTSANLDYQHRFGATDHRLSGQVILNHRTGDEVTTDELRDTNDVITSGRRSTEKGPSDELRAKIDYTIPLSGENAFEAGYQSRVDRSEDITELRDYDPSSGEYVSLPEFGHATEYHRDIHSLYGLFSAELGRFGFQGGLRGEYTDRLVELRGEEERFTIDRWDLFPTAHGSYGFSGGQQLMASYARRIERPRGWYLEPFETWVDAYNVRRGNPGLQPEYIDSYEFGYQTDLGDHFLSTEAYYRVTHNKVERVRSVYDENITLRSIENVGTDYALGTEIMLNLGLLQWWDASISGNVYNYRVEGELLGESFSREEFTWNSRLNQTFKIRSSTRVQVINIYNSPTVSSQGRREDYFTTNVNVKRDFLDRSMTATLQVNDIFQTSRHESTSEGANFRTWNSFTHRAPTVMFNISYNINNYKPERRRDRSGDDFNGEDEF
jgi:outer membrane cobalamin receptor